MDVELTRMSSKGQIVIPRKLREKIGAEEGSLFALASDKDSIVLRKVKTPSKEEIIRKINEMASKNRKRLEKMGIKTEAELIEKLKNIRR